MAKSRNLAPALLGGLLAVALGLVAWLALGESPAREIETHTESDAPKVAASLEREAPAVKLELDDRDASSRTRSNEVGASEESRAAVSDAAQLELADALWVEGAVRIPPETPLDEELEVVAEGKKFPTLGHHRVRVGVDGRFRVAFSKDTKIGWLRLEGRYCYLANPLKWKSSGPEAEVVLEPTLGGCIAGALTPPASASDVREVLAKARVVSGSRRMEDVSTSRSAMVGEDLRYELRGVPTHSTQYIEFDAHEWIPFERVEVRVEPGKVLGLDIACELGARVSGRVVDSAGAPVSNAQLMFRRGQGSKSESFEFLRHATSNKQGEFSVAGLRPGALRVVATRDGFLERELELGELVDAQVREGVEIVLDSGRFVRGVVKWNSGELATSAWVRVEEPRDEKSKDVVLFGEPRSHRVDENGRFELTGLGAGPYKVFAHAPEGTRPELGPDGKPLKKSKLSGPKWRAEAANVASGAELELVLTPGLSLAGAVVDELGAPITKFTVRASEARESAFDVNRGADVWSRFEAQDGRFSLEGLGPGAWSVSASAKGFTESDATPVQIPHSGAPVVLAIARVASVSGVVVDEAGKPVEKASVQAEWERGGRNRNIDSAAASTNSKGEFKLRDAPAGPVTLQVRHALFAETKSAPLSLAPGADLKGVRIVLVSGGTIRGRIHESLLVADAGWFVNMSGDGGAGWQHEQAGADGVFRFERVTPGKYRIHASLNRQSASVGAVSSASSSSISSLSGTVTVESGVEVEVVLGSPGGAPTEVRGRVTLAGEPVEGARVNAHRQGLMLSSASAPDGTYVFSLEAQNGYTISASLPEGGVSQHRRIDLADGAPGSVDFEFASGRIVGRVVDAAGEPVSNAWIQANLTRAAGAAPAGATSANLQPPPDGRFEFVGLAAGEYNVSVSSASFGSDAAKSFGTVVVEGVVVNEQEAGDELVIRVEPPAVLNCRVRASDGSPVAGAMLQTIAVPSAPSGVNFRVWQTDGAGREHIGGLSAGEYWVAARLDEQVGISPSSARVSSGESRDVEIELRRGGKLALTVQDVEGKPAKGRMHVVDSRGVDWTSNSSESGTGARTFGPLPVGVYEVSVSGKDLVSAVQRVNVAAGVTLSVTLTTHAQ